MSGIRMTNPDPYTWPITCTGGACQGCNHCAPLRIQRLEAIEYNRRHGHAPTLDGPERPCVLCFDGCIVTERLDASTPGRPAYVDGRTRCDVCGYDVTEQTA